MNLLIWVSLYWCWGDKQWNTKCGQSTKWRLCLNGYVGWNWTWRSHRIKVKVFLTLREAALTFIVLQDTSSVTVLLCVTSGLYSPSLADSYCVNFLWSKQRYFLHLPTPYLNNTKCESRWFDNLKQRVLCSCLIECLMMSCFVVPLILNTLFSACYILLYGSFTVPGILNNIYIWE